MSTSAQPDWTALAHSREFRELMASRRRFLVAGTVFYCAYFVAFLCLLGFAPDTMSDSVLGSVSLALVLGLPARAQGRPVGSHGAARRRGRRARRAALHQGPHE
jgi:uncharacterized membrane protein (DUF485 family)